MIESAVEHLNVSQSYLHDNISRKMMTQTNGESTGKMLLKSQGMLIQVIRMHGQKLQERYFVGILRSRRNAKNAELKPQNLTLIIQTIRSRFL